MTHHLPISVREGLSCRGWTLPLGFQEPWRIFKYLTVIVMGKAAVKQVGEGVCVRHPQGSV